MSLMLSFIIPSYNEEQNIIATMDSIREFVPREVTFEVIVVDNESTDQTAALAVAWGAKALISLSSNTIAFSRNLGAKSAEGLILVFLDADIYLTKDWNLSIVDTINELVNDDFIITGSRVSPTDRTSYLNKYWFDLMTQYQAPYINSGHLICTKKMFNLVGGFSENLQTAEDYDFSMKSKAVGAKMLNNPKLRVIHLGYPTTIKDFVIRERWHGKQDFQSWSLFFDSKIAWIATLNLIMFILSIVLSLLNTDMLYFLIYPLFMVLITLFLTIFKFGRMGVYSLLNTSAVFFFYLIGRSLSLLDRITNNN